MIFSLLLYSSLAMCALGFRTTSSIMKLHLAPSTSPRAALWMVSQQRDEGDKSISSFLTNSADSAREFLDSALQNSRRTSPTLNATAGNRGEYLLALQVSTIVLLFGGRFLLHPLLGSTISFLGWSSLIFGFVLFFAGIQALGKDFNFLALPPPKLITNGAFEIVRHPVYSGTILLAVSFAMLTGSFERTLLVGGLLFLCDKRATQEEELLKAQFGERWEEFKTKTTKKLIPYIY